MGTSGKGAEKAPALLHCGNILPSFLWHCFYFTMRGTSELLKVTQTENNSPETESAMTSTESVLDIFSVLIACRAIVTLPQVQIPINKLFLL